MRDEWQKRRSEMGWWRRLWTIEPSFDAEGMIEFYAEKLSIHGRTTRVREQLRRVKESLT